ncbi:MAG: carbohydrate ABC transporter permease [Deinococcota bacterium]|jgi:multiple sugar transport system permease protein|nr:carbohydrate ABC transporter permease [Deinococcota bacterium]
MTERARFTLGNWLLALFLVPTAFFMLAPFIWMISTSLKSAGAVFEYPPTFIPDPPRWDNYRRVFEVLPFARFFLNSLFVAAAVTVLQLVTSSLAAYAFARLRFPGRDALFLGYLGTLMIPAQVVIIPNFILLSYLGWIDTYQALILPAAFSAFGTFLLRQYFLTIPGELEDAAVVDGANHFQIYTRVILPLSGPALSALAIFTFLFNWNSFLYPLVVTNSTQMSTLTVGLNTLQGQYNTAWTLLMAGSVIALLPVLVVFIFAQRYFIKGITMTGIGGR